MKKPNYRTEAYRVFPTDVMPSLVKEQIDAKVRSLKTGEEAEQLSVIHDNGWSATKTFPPGSVVILMYKGAEVAMFYKRQVISMHSDNAADPVPQCAIQDPKEAWIRVEFLHVKSSMQRSTWFIDKEKALQETIKNFKGLADSRGFENDALYKTIEAQNLKVFELEAKIKTLEANAVSQKMKVTINRKPVKIKAAKKIKPIKKKVRK